MEKDKITLFVDRLKKIGVDVELTVNYPWVYLESINGQRIVERLHAEHGFTIAFLPIRANQEIKFTDLKEIFQLIRKYVKKT